MDTKELILRQALELFNDIGFEDTSGRLIAKKMEISQGNLRYHFARKEDIAEVLFDRFYEKFNKIISRLITPTGNSTFTSLLEVYQEIYQHYLNYWFIQNDLINLSKRIPTIKIKLQNDFENRRKLILQVFRRLIDNGYLDSNLDDFIYKKIIYLQIFIGDFWMPHSQLYFNEKPKGEIRHYNAHWITLLLPYLTNKGKAELKSYLKKKPNSVPPDFKKFIMEKKNVLY